MMLKQEIASKNAVIDALQQELKSNGVEHRRKLKAKDKEINEYKQEIEILNVKLKEKEDINVFVYLYICIYACSFCQCCYCLEKLYASKYSEETQVGGGRRGEKR